MTLLVGIKCAWYCCELQSFGNGQSVPNLVVREVGSALALTFVGRPHRHVREMMHMIQSTLGWIFVIYAIYRLTAHGSSQLSVRNYLPQRWHQATFMPTLHGTNIELATHKAVFICPLGAKAACSSMLLSQPKQEQRKSRCRSCRKLPSGGPRWGPRPPSSELGQRRLMRERSALQDGC